MISSSTRRVWGWPLAMGLLTASGLCSALVSDAWGDVWSWVGLGVPVAVMAGFGLRPGHESARPRAARSSISHPKTPKKAP